MAFGIRRRARSGGGPQRPAESVDRDRADDGGVTPLATGPPNPAVTPATDGRDAAAAKVEADARLVAAERRWLEVNRLVGSLDRLLQENHFSVRIARMFDIEDNRQ